MRVSKVSADPKSGCPIVDAPRRGGLLDRFVILTTAQLSRRTCFFFCSAVALALTANAAEHVTLKNGFDMICDHRENLGEETRLYVGSGDDNFVEVKTANIASIDAVVPVQTPEPASVAKTLPAPSPQKLTASELHELLTVAGAERNLDVDLLACVVHAESNGQVRAVSRTGAKGLMQLMPGTAAQLGVTDSFRPDQNIHGGTQYLNDLLLRYHDNLALALAAYNAGPKAVDHYHGVPPYRETRAYVARIIHEFNQRKLAEDKAARLTSVATSQAGERN